MDIFERNVPQMSEKLSKATIGIAGCGGLGSNIAHSLTRAGVGNLILADFDIIEPSNLNRQSFYLEDIGKPKVEVTASYLKRINRDIELTTYNRKLVAEDIIPLFGEVDIMIEAFDSAENKKWLLETWAKNRPTTPLICGNGLANYGKFDSLEIKKIGKIYICGDGKSDMSEGLCAPRILIVANMEANLAVEILMDS